MKWLLIALFAFEPSFAKDCKNIKAVAREAVAYSLVGAWEPFTTHACFKGEHFKYFRPELGSAEGEVIDPSLFVWFDKKKDSYSVEKITKIKTSYEISVKFVIAGKPLHTIYNYDPDPDYEKTTGICGFVINDLHPIYRRDCLIGGRVPAAVRSYNP